MYLLSWHGTLLRVETASGRLIQAPLVPQRPNARDFAIPAMAVAESGTLVLAQSDGVRLRPGPDAGTRLITIGPYYASVEPGRTEVRAVLTEPDRSSQFRIIAPEALAALRRLLRGSFELAGSALDAGAIRLREGWMLDLGGWEVPLGQASLLDLPGGDVFVAHADRAETLRLLGLQAAAGELFLRPDAPGEGAVIATDDAEFLALPRARLRLAVSRERAVLPLTQALAERDWLEERAIGGRPPAFAEQVCVGVLGQMRDAYVVLAGDAAGLCIAGSGETEADLPGGRLAALAAMAGGGLAAGIAAADAEAAPRAKAASARQGNARQARRAREAALMPTERLDWVSTEGSSLFLAQEALDGAPRDPGSVLLPYGRAPRSGADVVADLLPRLALLQPHAPADATILLPHWAAAEAEALLGLAGFGAIKVRREAAALCRVARGFELAVPRLGYLPASVFAQLREALWAAVPAEQASETPEADAADAEAAEADVAEGQKQEGQRYYLRPGPDGVRLAQSAPVEAVVRKQGFVCLEPAAMTPEAMVAAMREASFVIGASGGGLGWTGLCRPGTKVIELAPRAGYDPAQSEISGKLELVHLVLSCAGGPGRMLVSPRRLRAAIWLLAARQ